MGKLDGKFALVTGIATERSIADAIAEAFHEEGAELILSFATAKLLERNTDLVGKLGAVTNVCDVSQIKDINNLGQEIEDLGRQLDILVHSIAFADRDALGGKLTAVNREQMNQALQISAVSLHELVSCLYNVDLLAPNCSVIVMTYIGGERVVPQYGFMSQAKALLDSIARGLAFELGADPIVRGRVNLISAGPLRTPAANGIKGFRRMHSEYPKAVPLARNIEVEDVARTAIFLASTDSKNITGETIHVDAGFHMMGMMPQEES